MRLGICLIAVCALALPAFAQDAMDVPATEVLQQSDDGQFIAYAQPNILFVGAKLIDGTGAMPRSGVDVLVSDGKIVSISQMGEGRALDTKAATIIDMKGKTLLPGFVMMHEHLFYPMGKANYDSLLYSFPRLYLAGGTTTARTGGSMTPYGDLNLKRAIDNGDAIGPDFDITGPYLNGGGLAILKMPALADAADAKRTVDYWADEGVTSFKAYVTISRAELKAAIEAAHARGLKVTGHLCSVTYREAVDLGIDNLEHGFATMTDFYPGKVPDACPVKSQQAIADVDPPGAGVKSLIAYLVAHHVALTSTLPVFESFTPGRPEAPEAVRALLIPQLRAAYEKRWAEIPDDVTTKPYAVIFPKLLKMEKMFADAGGTLLAGTDPTGYGGVLPGYAAKREVELLVEAGFTFQQALKIATLNGAKFLGRDKEVGSIQVGKRADLIVIEGDPTHDVRALEHMPLVFKNGVGYDTQKIFDAMKGQVGLF